jgi:serine/threonine-protein kinase
MLEHWENEFTLLARLQECPYIVNLAGLTTSRNPYSPTGEDVVTAFLLEYGKGGTLKDVIGNVDEVRLLRWMLQVVKGLQAMHCRGIIHGDLKPDNIIITGSGQAKIIDLAQSGYTISYHAPEFPEIFASRDQWRSSVDIYSYGVVYWVLLSGDTAGLPELGSDGLPPVARLIAKCVAIDPLHRPSTEEVIDVLMHLSV